MTEEIDFRKTLNLPQTDFSMRAGLVNKEPRFLKTWEEAGLDQLLKEKGRDKPFFILHDGPPYANGHIHIGHALNKILKDVIVKSKTMSGFNSWYVPGWDCHGLPIEHQLMKEIDKGKHDVDAVQFRKDAHAYAMKYVGLQREEFKRLGIFGDWDDPYLTLDPLYEYTILKSLSSLHKKGYLDHGLKPVYWCVEHETALAEAEVEYEDITSLTVTAKFHVENPKDAPFAIPKGADVSLAIWTTTPWTLVANVAVAVHPSFVYGLFETSAGYLIIEKSLAESVFEKAGITDARCLAEATGDQLTALKYTHPFALRTGCPVVTADYITREDGTGLVHTAPGHGEDDYRTGLRHKLDIVMPVGDNGVYTEAAGPYAGQHIWKANARIVEDLREAGDVITSEKIRHSYPHSWRSKKPVIFRATHQWFLRVDHDGLREKSIREIRENVRWIPAAGEERIASMVAGRPDWCLSRQRIWGVPIPALKLKTSGEIRLYSEVIDHVADLVKKHGTDVWFERDVKDLVPAGFACPETGETDFEKTYDILDVWFDSGVSHQAVCREKMKRDLPVDLYLEGSDQHRGWFQSSLLPSVALDDRAPYKSVLTHGFVVDGEGRKMSKSMGNVISPQKVIAESGADILRLWVAASNYQEDIRVSREVLARMVDAYRKIRNTVRFILGNLYDFQPDTETLDYEGLEEIDRWALHRLALLGKDVRQAYEDYAFNRVYKRVYAFCNEELSNFYLDILKDRLYISSAFAPERKAAQTVLYHICDHLVRFLAPVLSFTAEEIFTAMPKPSNLVTVASIHLLEWEDPRSEWESAAVGERFEGIIALRDPVMKVLEEARREGTIGSSLEAKLVFESASDRDLTYLKSFGRRLADMFIVSQAEVQAVDSVNDGMGAGYPKTRVTVEKADGRKCARSWKYTTDVGADPDFPTLSLESARIVKELKHASKEDGREET